MNYIVSYIAAIKERREAIQRLNEAYIFNKRDQAVRKIHKIIQSCTTIPHCLACVELIKLFCDMFRPVETSEAFNDLAENLYMTANAKYLKIK